MTMSHIHFTGIGGVGMAALAVLLKKDGCEVDGCDLKPAKRTEWLESLGIPVRFGHSPLHVENADEVVYTPAVSKNSPEIAAAGRRAVSRGEKLASLVSSRDSVAVCGSHGKTTTSTFTAKLLAALGESVDWAIGGECGDFPVAGSVEGRPGAPRVLVVEADESDGTLALYHPSILVVTNCEYDHPDHFKTPQDYFACFDKARSNARDVVESESLGGFPGEIAETCGDAIAALAPHNRKNARAAVEVALRRGHKPCDIARVFAGAVAELPDRRFEKVAPQVYTDYAHHPTEMKCAIAMAREKAGAGRLRVVFQPHRYSRTKALAAAFPEAFALADEVVLAPTYAAFEEPLEGGSIFDLYAECRKREGKGALASVKFLLACSLGEAWRHAALSMRDGDLTLLLGAGDIISIAEKARNFRPSPVAGTAKDLAGLSFFRTGGASVGGGVKRVVGSGSNLWISDLTTDEEYSKPSGGAASPGASLAIPWMAGVPGTVGGWVKMNAGAFGHSISEVVSRVKASGKWLDKAECGFGYRTSAIDGEIEDVEFDEAALSAARAAGDAAGFLARRAKFPPRCCGSVFKNPPGGRAAGELLEAVGAKGMEVGGAYVFEGHANVIAARDGARSSDILALAGILRSKVKSRFGVVLEPEIQGLEFGEE